MKSYRKAALQLLLFSVLTIIVFYIMSEIFGMFGDQFPTAGALGTITAYAVILWKDLRKKEKEDKTGE